MPLLRDYVITSHFGPRKHPVTNVEQLHEGIDIRAHYEDIYAYGDGEVLRTGYHKNLGYYLDIDHGYYITRYQHLSKFRVEAGRKIKRKELIAVSGNTGMSTGPHLHFGIKIKETGKWVDPEMFSPVTKIEIDIDGKEYKGLLDHEEEVSYVEVRKPFEYLGHEVSWSSGRTLIDIKKCSGLSEKEMLELTKSLLVLKHEIQGLEELLNKIKK